MAVRHGYGKIAGTDALVFAYDTGDTRNSYKGEPTVNLTTDAPSQGGWSGTYEVLNSFTKAFRFIVNNFAANPGAGWRSFTWDLRAYTGQSITISATVNVPAASPGTFAWIMMGQGNTYTNNSGAGGYLGYSVTSERVYKSSTVEEHITWSGIIGNSGTANQPSGHVGFTIWYNNGTPGINSYVEVSNVQIEIKSHATPFVNGTRSSTQGLLDLTGNSTIDLANVSFDSNAQMFFDGTDDYIDIPNSTTLFSGTQDFTVEAAYNMEGQGGGAILGNYGPGYTTNHLWFSGQYGIWLDGGVYAPGYPLSNGRYNMVGTRESGVMKLYLNGVLVNSGTRSNSIATDINYRIGADVSSPNEEFTGDIYVVKAYSRALTADEVRNNYNQYRTRFNI